MNKTYRNKLPKDAQPLCSTVYYENGEVVVNVMFKEKFQPKDGDFLATKDGRVFIYNGSNTDIQYGAYCGIDIYNEIIVLNYFSSSWTGKEGCRFASPEGKAVFLERLEKECHKRWNEETKQLEDIRWEPFNNEDYWFINEDFIPIWDKFSNKNTNHIFRVKMNNCFKTKEAAQKVADQIKEIFKNSKAE